MENPLCQQGVLVRLDVYSKVIKQQLLNENRLLYSCCIKQQNSHNLSLTENREIISGQVTNLKGMTKRLDEKRMVRRTRRSRLRHRKPRFEYGKGLAVI